MDIAVKDGRIVGVRGRAVDLINHGRLDPKDLYGWQANNSPDRHTAHGRQHPVVYGDRYRGVSGGEPERLRRDLFEGGRSGALGLLCDLRDLLLVVTECEITWTLIAQAAYGTRDRDLLELADGAAPMLSTQLAWLRTRMKAEAPQALVVVRD